MIQKMRDRKVQIHMLSGLFCNSRLDDGFCRKMWYNFNPLFAPFKDLLVPTPVVERTFLETDGEHRRCPLNFQSKCGNIRHNG